MSAVSHRRRAPLPRTAVPRQPAAPRRHGWSSERNPYYGYDYNPSWPSILSIAHDTTNSACVYVITDRPCTLQAPGFVIPLEFYTGLYVLWGEMILPNKFRFQMSAPVVQGSNWRWGDGYSQLNGAGTGSPINPAHGTCDDVAGPNVPIPTASVVSAAAYGNSGVLTFDKPLRLAEPLVLDDALMFDGTIAPQQVNLQDPQTLWFEPAGYVAAGSTWAISRQPGWIITPVSVPQGGTF